MRLVTCPVIYPVFCVVAAVLLSSCSSISVKSDFDPNARFYRFKTFDWRTPLGQASVDPLYQNPLLDQRIRKAIESRLAVQGIQPSGTEKPDFDIVYHLRVQQKIATTSAGFGVGYYYGPFSGYGGPGFSIYEYTEGTLIIDFVDPEKKELFWRGYAVGALDDPGINQEQINSIVTKILEQYPPKPEQIRAAR